MLRLPVNTHLNAKNITRTEANTKMDTHLRGHASGRPEPGQSVMHALLLLGLLSIDRVLHIFTIYDRSQQVSAGLF